MPQNRVQTRLSATRARDLLDYNARTGELTWRIDRGPRIKAGDEAGHLRKTDGLIVVTVDGEVWLAHRLAWYIATGEFPVNRILLRDSNPSNLKFSNLLNELDTYSQTPSAIAARQSRLNKRMNRPFANHPK